MSFSVSANSQQTNIGVIALVTTKTALPIVFVSLLILSAFASADPVPPAAAVASAQPMATAAGEEILKKGGNAFDAAIAVSAALGVVEPAGSGFGGGGFWLLHRAQDGKQVLLDARETAPALAHERIYQDEQGNVIKDASINGPLSAGIPGLPAGLVYLAEHYGQLPLKESLAPAIRYAKKGFYVTPRYQKLIRWRQPVLAAYEDAGKIFLENGQAPQLGYRIHQPDLAKTIEQIATKGLSGFYHGEMAERLVRGVRDNGGIWSKQDLADYMVVERKPVVTEYRGIRIVSAPPPSSGGIVLAQALEILAQFDLVAMNRIARKHHVIEAMRRAYRDRAVFLGDPDFVNVPVKRLLDKDYLAGLALTIDPDQATPSAELGDTPGLDQRGAQTTHFSVIDHAGNRVAGTLSINLPFGSGFVAPGTGVLLNNEMDDFSVKENTPNAYGLTGGHANAVAPGKRPLSSMTPTFLETKDRIGIVGTPGGSRIISMVLLATLDFADGRLPESWVSVPRYHHQYEPDLVQFERFGLSPGEQKALTAMGHKLKERSRRYGNMHAILWDKKANKVHAASDPRGEGEAKVIAQQPDRH